MDQSENQLQLDDMGTIGPGRYLLKARENQKLRIEDVAIELRLIPSQVTALEEDDYSAMPEVTYVRGYLRNYARLLGLSPDEILLAHARITRNDDFGKVAVSPVGEKEIHTAGLGVKLLGVFILVAAIAGVVYWYLDRDADQPVTVAVTPEPAAPVTEEVPTGSSKLSFADPEPAPAPAVQVAVDAVEADEQPAAASVQQDSTAVAPAVTESEAGQMQTENVEPVSATEPVADQPAVQSIEPPAEIASDMGQLVISYEKSCWTDIRDASGKKLVYKTIPAGQTITLEGKTPFTLFFGFAVGVDLKFNGESIDLKQHTRGVFARLTLDN